MFELRRTKFECKLMNCSSVLNYFGLGLTAWNVQLLCYIYSLVKLVKFLTLCYRFLCFRWTKIIKIHVESFRHTSSSLLVITLCRNDTRADTRADSSSNGPESSRLCSAAVRVCPSVHVPWLAILGWTYRWTTRAGSRWTLLYWTCWPRPVCILLWLSTQLEAGRQTRAGTSTSLSGLSTHPWSRCWRWIPYIIIINSYRLNRAVERCRLCDLHVKRCTF